MKAPATIADRIAAFPTPLRQLIDAELAAGNRVVEVASCFPAPPAGAYAKLAQPVTTRPHASSGGITYYHRNTSLYSGEWADAARLFFVLEPPAPPPAEPDMDAIRRAHASPPRPKPAPKSVAPDSIVGRFEDSMVIDYEKWHDGIGYDLELLKKAKPEERALIEDLILSRGVQDWRDVEALAAVDTDAARRALRAALAHGNAEIRSAVMRHAPGLVAPAEKTAALVSALRSAGLYGGLSQTLDQVAEFHPPEVIAELLRGTLARDREASVNFAAMLLFVHGQAPSPFDWQQRPFFLRFGSDNRAERETAFRELCEKIGVRPETYLGA